MITVVNIKNHVRDGTRIIHCGRGTPLGNPFIMKNKTLSERDRVCDQYKAHFKCITDGKLPVHATARKMLAEIKDAAARGDVQLHCYCAPLRCHCDTIKAYIEGLS